jgi:hypothetical protein
MGQHIGKCRKTASCGFVIPISCWFTHNTYTKNCNSSCRFIFQPEHGDSKFLQTVHTFLPPYGITSWKATISMVTIRIRIRIHIRHQGPKHMPRMHCSLKACCATLLPPFWTFPQSPPDVSTSYVTREIQAAKGGTFGRG